MGGLSARAVHPPVFAGATRRSSAVTVAKSPLHSLTGGPGRPILSLRNGLLTSWDRSSQPTDARATVLVCIAVAVPYWASRPRCELTKAKSVRYVFPIFGTRGAHIAVIAEHHIEAPTGGRKSEMTQAVLLVPLFRGLCTGGAGPPPPRAGGPARRPGGGGRALGESPNTRGGGVQNLGEGGPKVPPRWGGQGGRSPEAKVFSHKRGGRKTPKPPLSFPKRDRKSSYTRQRQ